MMIKDITHKKMLQVCPLTYFTRNCHQQDDLWWWTHSHNVHLSKKWINDELTWWSQLQCRTLEVVVLGINICPYRWALLQNRLRRVPLDYAPSTVWHHDPVIFFKAGEKIKNFLWHVSHTWWWTLYVRIFDINI
jgi:hypothetical protein